MLWPAAVAGPAKLALAVQELGSTRLAPSRRDGAADLRATPTAAGPSSDRQSVFRIGFWGDFSVFWDRFLMISGSNLGGLPPPEHLWDLLAAAGGPRCSKV